jgi:ketosteroid isomerase-like protein
MRQLLAVTVVSVFVASGCAPAVEPPVQEIDLEAERVALMAADDAFSQAYSTSDDPIATVFAHFLDDANVLAPDMPMARGKEACVAIFAALEALPEYSLSWKAEIAEVGGAADLGYTIGPYHMEYQDPEGNPVIIDGKFMTIWKKQADGAWKIAVDMFNTDGAPPGDE